MRLGETRSHVQMNKNINILGLYAFYKVTMSCIVFFIKIPILASM